MKTTREILQEIDERGLAVSVNRWEGTKAGRWGVRIGTVHPFAEADTFDDALGVAWAEFEAAGA